MPGPDRHPPRAGPRSAGPAAISLSGRPRQHCHAEFQASVRMVGWDCLNLEDLRRLGLMRSAPYEGWGATGQQIIWRYAAVPLPLLVKSVCCRAAGRDCARLCIDCLNANSTQSCRKSGKWHCWQCHTSGAGASTTRAGAPGSHQSIKGSFAARTTLVWRARLPPHPLVSVRAHPFSQSQHASLTQQARAEKTRHGA